MADKKATDKNKSKKRKPPQDGMLISRIRTKVPYILWGFIIIFAGSLFYTFGGSLLPDSVDRQGRQNAKNAKVKIPDEVAKVDDTALRMELFNDTYVRILESGDYGNVARNYFMTMYLKSQSLDRLIQQQIFLEEAKKRKMRVTSGEVNKNLRSYRDYLLGESSKLEDPGLPARVKFFVKEKDRDKALKEILLRRGVSAKTFKAAMRRETLVQKVQKQLLDEAKANEEGDAKKRAEGVLAKVKAGEDFYTLAVQFSEDPSTKETGGDRGWFARGTWEKEFENAAFSMAPGQVSDLVKSDSGFHVILVEGKKIAVGPDFEREKPALIERLSKELGRAPTDADIQTAFEEVKARHILIKTRRDDEILTEWFTNERKNHKVEIINPELKAYRFTAGIDQPPGQERDDSKTLALYDKAIEADPANEYLHYFKGFVYEQMHSEAAGKDENDPYEKFSVAVTATATAAGKDKKGETNYMKKALEEYREAFEIAKEKDLYVTDPLLYLGVARAYEALGQKKKARVYLAQSVDFAAGNIGQLRQIEESLVKLGGAKKALAEVRELIAELAPPEQADPYKAVEEEAAEEEAETENEGGAEGENSRQ